ncbi:methylmalonyl-CoA epimerase [Glycomyces paridis]|uniref:Methylmalonyl-CoA epimerase n=1 Tax=Glycomyces paridis TaxID=2126555 RepID=A0A4S8PRN2_9ACTN|nr:methylmalonyl-CoA epimerase [Glycomyces paridis]THV32222.1 methylmalonyl-CoA epimerase [Glycomyces paridis]
MTFIEGIGLRRIDHVGIAVPDLGAALEWYEGALGGREVHREVNEAQGVVEAMVAWPEGGAQVQLLAPLDETSPIAKFIGSKGPGLQQLAFTVADVDAAAAALRERGARVLYDEARQGTGGSRINFVHPKDAGGVLVELVEPA